jgi:hypothetical protein
MEMMMRRVKKETSTMAVEMSFMMGTVSAHAKSSIKLKLKMDWLSSESTPRHLNATMKSGMRARIAKGARM